MDLSQYDTVKAAEQGATLALRDPSGKPLLDKEGKPALTILLVGTDSKEFQESQHRIANKRMQQSLNRGQKARVSLEEIESDGLDLLVTCTKSWQGFELDGQPLECSKDNVRNVYTRFPWIREQVDAFINDRANFLGNSSTNS